GVATIIASTSGSVKTASVESTAEVRGKFLSTKARRSGLESTTYFTKQVGSAEKFRSKFGPQYPHPICASTRGLDSMLTRMKVLPAKVPHNQIAGAVSMAPSRSASEKEN